MEKHNVSPIVECGRFLEDVHVHVAVVENMSALSFVCGLKTQNQ